MVMEDNTWEATAEWLTQKCDKFTDQELQTMVAKLQQEMARRNNHKDTPSKDTSLDKQAFPVTPPDQAPTSQQHLGLQDEDNISFYIEHSMDKAVDEERRLHVEGLTQNTTKEQLKTLFDDFKL